MNSSDEAAPGTRVESSRSRQSSPAIARSVTNHSEPGRLTLLIWVTSQFLVISVAVLSHYLVFQREVSAQVLYQMWHHFESLWYENIAQSGYVGAGDFRYNTAYFPGTAMLMRLGLVLGVEAPLTGMFVSFVAGGFAAVALGKLVQQVGGSPTWAVIAWVSAPTIVFVTAPWSEALFAGFAFWSWYLARNQQWWLASVLAAAASFTRINGVFLTLGLFAMWWTQRPRRGSHLVPLGLPLTVVAAHFIYLWTLTGRFDEWRAVQREFWGRETVDPVTAFRESWNLIFTFVPGSISTRFVAEIAAAVLMLVGLVVLLRLKWWPESLYVGLTLIALVTSSFYYSIPRTLTILFPLWMLLGLVLSRRKWIRWLYLALAVPLTILVIGRFIDGQWIS